MPRQVPTTARKRHVATGCNVALFSCALLAGLPGRVEAAGSCPAIVNLTVKEFATAAMLVTLGLILFSMGFEKLEHLLLHKPSKVTRPVVRSMFQELTGLGFLGVVLFVIESTPALTTLSKAMLGDDNADALASVIHQVHMALFLVLCIFLANVLLLMIMAMRQQKKWSERELACLDRKELVHGYSSFISRPRRDNPCERLYRWLCVAHHESYERLVYNAMRARFIKPGGDSETKSSRVAIEAADDGSMLIELNNRNAEAYRKKLMVYAFQSKDPCRFDKHWGPSTGSGGDFVIVGVDGDLYSCPRATFEATYEPIAGEPHRYRKTGVMYARHMSHAFKVRTDNGFQRGAAGSYLVQDAQSGQQYCVTSVEFERLYEPVNVAHVRSVKDLPRDFDFGMYLTVRLGNTLGEIVTLEWHTWCIILSVVAIMWLTILTDVTILFFVVNQCVGIGWSCCNVLYLRKMYSIRDHLVPRNLVNRAAASGSFVVPTHKSNVAAAQAAAPPTTVQVLPDGGDTEEGKAQFAGAGAGAGAGDGSDETKGGPPSVSTNPSVRMLQQGSTLGGSTPKNGYTYVNSAGATTVVSGDALSGRGNANRPLYLDLPPRAQACCSRRPANQHEQLFWCGHKGVENVKEFVRANILFMSMFLAVNCMILEADCTAENFCAVRMVLIVVPQLINIFSLPRVVTAYVVVSNIEMLRKNKVVGEIVRKQRTEKAMRALRLLSALRAYTKKVTAEIVPANDPEAARKAYVKSRDRIRGAAERVYGKAGTATYLKRRHEFKEAFAIFDRESTGHVRKENIKSLFELLGLGDSAEQAAACIVAELDVDGQGTVEFEEFFNWTAAQREDQDPEELTRDIFNIIDRDHSHDITASELRDTLSSLGAVMSPEDIMRTVADADHDGSGTIGFHEFAALMKKHMKEAQMHA